jgi:hypothetical protein
MKNQYFKRILLLLALVSSLSFLHAASYPSGSYGGVSNQDETADNIQTNTTQPMLGMDPDPSDPLPIGDDLIPLTAAIIVYGFVIRKKRKKNSL